MVRVKSDPRFPVGHYEHGRLVMPPRYVESVSYPESEKPHPRCLKCGTQLVRRHGKKGYFWGCGNFPHCRFTLSDGVVQEAIRRQIKRLKEERVTTPTAS